MPEEALADWIRLPGVAVGSDGMPMVPNDDLKWDTPYEKLPNVHPRFAGSFAKILRLARENKIPLMQAIAMTSYNYAKPLGDTGLKAMQVRGRMQEGMVADIVIFDPKTVTDNATYAKGTLLSTGIPHAIVNGIMVMKDSVPLQRFDAGQPIRFEVEDKGRFTPLSKERWVEEYYVTPHDHYGGF
jgi:N-acyl-D-aspartate/D-glutamate deacylase